MAHEIGQYTIVDYPMFNTIHEHAEEQLAMLKRRAKKDKIEDCKCLVCDKEFCLIISPTFIQIGLRELCQTHASEFNYYRKQSNSNYQSEGKWAEAKKRGEL
jgi:hypothetical protein